MDPIANIYFSLFMIIAVVCGVGVLASRHPISGAMNLIGVMLSLAGIYGLLSGPFLGIVQILVYAGAIMMLVVFVIMVLNSAKERRRTPSGPYALPALILPVALVVCTVLVLRSASDARGLKMPEPEQSEAVAQSAAPLVSQVTQPGVITAEEKNEPGNIGWIAREMFDFDSPDAWFVLFEIVGVVLLVALTGAVLLAKREIGTRDEETTASEGGQV